MTNGERKFTSVDHPRGHVKNPASDEDIERKFIGMNSALMSKPRMRSILDRCWQLDTLDDVSGITSLLRVRKGLA
jgi:2-methylcitrate dehydratase